MWALGPKKENKLAREVGWMDVIQDPLNSVVYIDDLVELLLTHMV